MFFFHCHLDYSMNTLCISCLHIGKKVIRIQAACAMTFQKKNPVTSLAAPVMRSGLEQKKHIQIWQSSQRVML
jgi:hypothetical protein